MNKKLKPKKLKDKDCIAWLEGHGYFAYKVYVDGGDPARLKGGTTFILAMRHGKPLALCTGGGDNHCNHGIMREFEQAGGKSLCITSLEQLETYHTSGIQS